MTMLFFWGLFLFFAGLEGGKKGLKFLAGKSIESRISRYTDNFFICILIGIVVTGILQSSSAVSVIIISLVEAKLIKLKPAIGVIMGANIGTTLTVQIISLPVLSFYPYLLLTGVFFMITGIVLDKKFLNAGFVIFSFGILFSGLKTMTTFFNTRNTSLLIKKILFFSGKNNYLGILTGGITTAIIQSSSIITGITVSIAHSGLITLPVAIAIALGSNIGTCITALLASINIGKTGRAVALGHLIFNLAGVLVMLPFLNYFIRLVLVTGNSLPRQIANAHTLFNLINLIVFLPFVNTFVRLLKREE